MDANLLVLVNGTDANCQISNDSAEDTYHIEIVWDDNSEPIVETFQLELGQVPEVVHLMSALLLGNFPCTATVTHMKNDLETNILKLNITLRVA